MKLDGRVRVALPREEAWRRINDPDVLRRCVPGLTELVQTRDDHFDAVIEMALPAIKGRFEGSVEFVERAPPERLRVQFSGKGAPGFLLGDVALDLLPGGAATEFAYTAEVQLGATVARLGQRMISGVAKSMAAEFFEALERATPGAPSEPAPSLAASLLVALLRLLPRLFGAR